MQKKQGTTKMRFSKDQYYVKAATKEHDLINPKYRKDIVYEIDNRSVQRWMKRGGEIVKDAEQPKVEEKVETVSEVVKEEKVETAVEDVKEPVEVPEEKAEDILKPEPQKNSKPYKHGGNKR